MTLFLVIRSWPGGKREYMAAFFNEEKARYEAGRQVGKEGALISLETIEVVDEPSHTDR